MATVTANQTYKGTISADGTVTVKGRGECFVKVVGNDYGSGTLTILDDLAETGTFAAVDVDGTAISLTTGTRSYHIKYHPSDTVQLRLNLASSSSPDLDVYVSFEFPPAA